MPGPERARELLGRAAHQRRGRDHAERRGEEDRDRVGVRDVEHDRERDERDEQVGPALAAEQECAELHRAGRLRDRGHFRRSAQLLDLGEVARRAAPQAPRVGRLRRPLGVVDGAAPRRSHRERRRGRPSRGARAAAARRAARRAAARSAGLAIVWRSLSWAIVASKAMRAVVQAAGPRAQVRGHGDARRRGATLPQRLVVLAGPDVERRADLTERGDRVALLGA